MFKACHWCWYLQREAAFWACLVPFPDCHHLDLWNALDSDALLSWGLKHKGKGPARLEWGKVFGTEIISFFFFLSNSNGFFHQESAVGLSSGFSVQVEVAAAWERIYHAVSAFIQLSGWMCRPCWAPCCYGYSCRATWACCMQKTAQEMSMPTVVSAINARHTCSESWLNSDCKHTLGRLWCGTCSPISTSWEKKSCKIWFTFLPVQFQAVQRASSRLNAACHAEGDSNTVPGGSLTTLLRCTPGCIFYYSHSFFNFCVLELAYYHHALPELFCF